MERITPWVLCVNPQIKQSVETLCKEKGVDVSTFIQEILELKLKGEHGDCSAEDMEGGLHNEKERVLI